MKKFLVVAALLLTVQLSFGQAVNDQAVIPVSVTLNSILRLNVVSGGSINFVVNTITQYSGGIASAPRYYTTFTVASSRAFNVNLVSESGTFIGRDAGLGMPLANVGYTIASTGTGSPTLPATMPIVLKSTDQVIVTSVAGGIAANRYQIQWELATPAILGATDGLGAANTLLVQSLPADNYVTNVFLTVSN